MRTKSRKRYRCLALAVLAGVIFLPELAQAQQTGLFPLAPIRRQRVPCDQEDSVYKIYKQRYWGYHPTCWEPFPKDWGCKSNERADVAKAFKDRPLDVGISPGGRDSPFEENAGPEIQPVRPVSPTLPPPGRSVFDEMDEPPARPGGAAPGAAPGGNQPAPRLNSPFNLEETPARPGGGAATPKPGDAPAAPTPPGAQNAPPLSAPADRTAQAAPAHENADDDSETHETGGPLLALPTMMLPPITDAGVPFGVTPPDPATVAANTAAVAANNTTADSTNTQPPAAAPRRGLLSGLFNSLGLNWTRR
jgi:hypothetical protein